MLAKNFKKSLLAVNIGLIMTAGLTGTVYAADEVKAQEEVEVIEVRGIRRSLEASLNTKRFADGVVDAITAEDIGKFPDKNVADSLSRITGVGVSREFGEGEKITIRGSDPSVNRSLLNGQNVGTADWFILDNPSRSFNYTLLPSSLVGSLEVHKSPTAKIDEGSIGGTVIMRTRQPLDLDANTVNIGVQAQYSEASGETDPQVDALYSWKNEEENFGFLVSLTKQDRQVRREGLEVLGWQERQDAQGNSFMAPKDIGNPIFRQDRERETIFASLQYAPSDKLELTLNILDSKMDSDNVNSNFLIRPQNDGFAEFSDVTIVDGNMVGGTVATDGAYEWDIINRESSTQTTTYDLQVNYEGDDFKLDFQIGVTDAKGGTYKETSWAYGPAAKPGYSFDLTGKPTVNTQADLTNGAEFTPGWVWGGAKPTTDKENYAQIDLELPVEFGPFTTVETGLKYRDHDRTQGRHAYSWHGPKTATDPAYDNYLAQMFGNCPNLSSCGFTAGSESVADAVVGGNVVNQLIPNTQAFRDLAFAGDVYAIHDNLAEIWEINEKIFAGYVQGNFSGEAFRGNVGVRVVQTKQDSASWSFSGDSWGLNTINREWLTPAIMDWVSESNDYTEILPSFNIAFDAADDKIIRFSSARVMARSNFSDLAPVESVGDLNAAAPIGTAGNPKLKPQIADQFDVTYEWYFNDSSLFSVAYFYKDIQSYRTSDTYQKDFFNQSTEQWRTVTLTQPANGLGGSTDGFEVSYQQDFGGYGVVANYTYTNATSDQDKEVGRSGSGLVQGASRHMANLTGYYENDSGFGARLMYNYRSAWFKGVGWTGDEVYNTAYGQLDFSSSYDISENISVVFEAVNLTNEKVEEYSNGDPARIMSIYENGRRYVLGANFRF
ncbi:TonB-dependent receptor [Pseudoalteromonas tunicata]|uniref:TonB-dependent receptor n=1 Tax=Pseudoalteromonas tunicata TaxID=314281 RepID=UPI00273EF765|nr:TonB-dependent receptor [Pseudoalteromonas tunicata]MDP5211452.1 TonB-dependent receptor [Pseudoalteromonas tunicata]